MNKVPTGKGKADADIKGKGPGPVRGSEFGKVSSGPKQEQNTGQPKGKSWSYQKDKGGWRGEGEGDAACGDM